MFNIKHHLYRAKKVTDNKWEIGFLVKYAQGYAIHPTHDTSLVVYVQEDTVGQCSGLRDKNGIWIYDGDVLTTRNTPIVIFGDSVYRTYYGLGVVRCGEYRNYHGWYLECIKSSEYMKVGDTRDIWPESIGYFEIVGNIYDNPDMIQQSGTPH